MPAAIAYRRWDATGPDTLAPDVMYTPTQRFAIVALGLVIAVVVLPLGQMPSLLTGQTALVSATLQVGDRV